MNKTASRFGYGLGVADFDNCSTALSSGSESKNGSDIITPVPRRNRRRETAAKFLDDTQGFSLRLYGSWTSLAPCSWSACIVVFLFRLNIRSRKHGYAPRAELGAGHNGFDQTTKAEFFGFEPRLHPVQQRVIGH